MANRPILQIMHAGYGTTPPCPQAKFAPGDVVKVRRLSYLKHLPERAAIALVVPPGFPPEHAMADARGEPRPLMTTVPKRIVTYIVAFDSDPRPQLIREANLLPTKEPRVEVGWTTDTVPESGAEAAP